MSRRTTLGRLSSAWRTRLRRAALLVPLVLLLMTTLFASDPQLAFAYSATSKDYVEIVIANGQYYAYDQGNPNGVIPPGWSGPLNDATKAPRYNLNGGPCTFAPPGQPCTFENYSIYQYHGHRWEAIEAYGRYWNFDLDNNYAPIGGNGGYLSSLSFYNTYYTNQPIRDGTATFTGPGPCYGITGSNCKLDSRGFYWRNNRLYDAATSSQQGEDYYYVWDETNNSAITLVDAGRLKDTPRFAAPGGPCDPARIGTGRCVFDTRDFFYDPTTHHLIESLNAQGQFWNFDMDAYFDYADGRDLAPAYGNNGGWLSDITRYNQPGRPCYQRPHEQCIMNARLFQYNLGADMLWELEGFGESTIGGLGGRVVQVTKTDDSGVGTLRWALEQGADTGNPDTPLIITFAPGLSSIINLQRPICVASNKTLDGRGSNVAITGWGLRIVKKSNVIINNVTIQDIKEIDNKYACTGENKLAFKDQDEYQDAPAGDDAIRLVEASNIWLHHLTLKHSIDGLVDIGSNGDDDTTTSR